MEPSKSVKRPILPNRILKQFALLAGGLFLCVALALLVIADMDWRSGAPFFQTCAMIGSLFLLSPAFYSLAKRTGRLKIPNAGLITHIIASLIGSFFIALHILPSISGYPMMLVGVLVGLLGTGFLARLCLNKPMAHTMGSKLAAFSKPDPSKKQALQQIITAKTDLLSQIDSTALEATFSPALAHWRQNPWLCWRYQTLIHRENKLVGTRQSVAFSQRWWRPFHMLLALCFYGGLVIHGTIALFFADIFSHGTAYWWYFY